MAKKIHNLNATQLLENMMMNGFKDSALVLPSKSPDVYLVSCPADPHPLSDNESLPSPSSQLADHKDPTLVLPVAAFEHHPPPPTHFSFIPMKWPD